MMHIKPIAAGAMAVIALAGCVPTQMGPTIMAMPTPGKPFETFAVEQDYCRGYANTQVGASRDEANNSAVGAAVIGTVLGAGLGAAIGGGGGAAIGAAGGALGGTGIGASNSARGGWPIQRQYDVAYAQCMYAKGNQVTGFPPPVPQTPTITPTPQSGAVGPQAGTIVPQPLTPPPSSGGGATITPTPAPR